MRQRSISSYSGAAVAATFQFCYHLGRNLYVPLTSQCHNEVSLPQSRGPEFMLPVEVISVLRNVRMIEFGEYDCDPDLLQEKLFAKHVDISTSESIGNQRFLFRDYLTQEQQQQTKENNAQQNCDQRNLQGLISNWECFEAIGRNNSNDCDYFLSKRINMCNSVEDIIINEVGKYFEAWSEILSDDDQNTLSVTFAGEGEPTIRPLSLLSLSRKISTLKRKFPLHLRLVTNGIVHPSAAEVLTNNGVTGVSIALMTGDRKQYSKLMGTAYLDKILLNHRVGGVGRNCHEQVCNFVTAAVECGLDVELTGVERPDVDMVLAEELGINLGVQANKFRWRPYFRGC